MTAFRTKHLAIACGAALSVLLYGCAPMTPAVSNQSIGNYQFDYQVQSPSDIAAQVFSGQDHTYVSLPTGVKLQAATGNGKLYTPKRHGPYWEVKGLATEWTFATTQGIVVAHATGAALQIATVHQAMAEVQATASTTPPQSSIPAQAANSVKTATDKVAGVHPAKKSSMVHKNNIKAITSSIPATWMAPKIANATAPNALTNHHALNIPGSYGRSLPLNQALQRMMPAGWTSHINAPVSPSLPVLWHKGPWTQSLQRMARDNLLVTHVSWGKHQVSVTASPAMMAGIPGMEAVTAPKIKTVDISETKSKETETIPLKENDHIQKYDQKDFHWGQAKIMSGPASNKPLPLPDITNSPDMVTTPAPVSMPVEINFVAKSRQMLSHDMRIYLKKKGWSMAWNLTKDYPISVGFTLQGSTKQVLQQIMNLYPIMITGDVVNHTVVVTSNTQF